MSESFKIWLFVPIFVDLVHNRALTRQLHNWKLHLSVCLKYINCILRFVIIIIIIIIIPLCHLIKVPTVGTLIVIISYQ